MAGTLDWSSPKFSAFAGGAKLDATFLQSTIQPITKKLDLRADIQKFRNWVNRLREDPEKGGIPAKNVDDVKKVLDTFFPIRPGSTTEFSTVRIRGHEDPPNSGLQSAVPLKVHFGTGDYEMQIMDASTALGYIFSVATPTTEKPTWKTYYLPLLVFFSRCLYLAFIAHNIEVDPMITSVADVPRFACTMYVGDGASPQRYFYSSTVSLRPSSLGNSQVERFAERNMLDHWRRSEIMEASLSNVPVEAGERAPKIPSFCPLYARTLVDKLFIKLRQASEISKAVMAAWAALTSSFVAMYLKGPPQQTVPPIPLHIDRLKGHKTIGTKLEDLLFALIQLRLDEDYSNGSQKVAQVVQDFFRIYLTPHTFLPTDTTFTNEIPEPSDFKKVRDATVLTFCQGMLASVLSVLNDLFNKEMGEGFRQTMPFGRCAETYCVTSLLPNYFSWIDSANPSMSDVRGLSTSVVDVGSSFNFQEAFTSVELAKTVEGGPYRLPCANCEVLLPLYKLDVSDKGYNADTLAVWT